MSRNAIDRTRVESEIRQIQLRCSHLNIRQGLRTINAIVNQGDELAKVGCVGNSLTGHIHFMVRPGKTSTTTIGVTFTDVSDDNGIPRTFGSYTSGNRRVP